MSLEYNCSKYVIWSIIRYFTQKFYTFDSEFSYIEVWFTNQNSKMLEIEDKTNTALVIKV